MATPGFLDIPGDICRISAEPGTTTTASVGAGRRADARPGGAVRAAMWSISVWRPIAIVIPFDRIHTIRGRWWRAEPLPRPWSLSIAAPSREISRRHLGIAAAR